MSKSLGNVLDPFKVIEVFGTDALRYYLLREVALGQDGSISPGGFENRYNTELANEYGNLASRTLAMVSKYRDGVVPEAQPEAELAGEFHGLPEAVAARLDRVEVSGALEDIWQRVRRLNRYVQDEEPWQLAKDPEQAERLDSVLVGLAEGLRTVSVLLLPWVPESAERLLAALGREDSSFEAASFGTAAAGARVGELGQLFPKVDGETAAKDSASVRNPSQPA
jgi:methionyl-tRNA synthetase